MAKGIQEEAHQRPPARRAVVHDFVVTDAASRRRPPTGIPRYRHPGKHASNPRRAPPRQATHRASQTPATARETDLPQIESYPRTAPTNTQELK